MPLELDFEASRIHYDHTNSTGVSFPLNVVVIVGGSVLGTLIVVLNVVMILAFYVSKHLRHFGDHFILNLAIADLIMGLSVLPLFVSYTVTTTWNMGKPLCLLWLFTDFTVLAVTNYIICTISLDRYALVAYPIWYRNIQSKRLRNTMMLLPWLFAGTMYGFVIIVHVNYTDSPPLTAEGLCQPTFHNNMIVTAVTITLEFFIPLLFLIVVNFCIYRNLRRRSRRKVVALTNRRSSLVVAALAEPDGETEANTELTLTATPSSDEYTPRRESVARSSLINQDRQQTPAVVQYVNLLIAIMSLRRMIRRKFSKSRRIAAQAGEAAEPGMDETGEQQAVREEDREDTGSSSSLTPARQARTEMTTTFSSEAGDGARKRKMTMDGSACRLPARRVTQSELPPIVFAYERTAPPVERLATSTLLRSASSTEEAQGDEAQTLREPGCSNIDPSTVATYSNDCATALSLRRLSVGRQRMILTAAAHYAAATARLLKRDSKIARSLFILVFVFTLCWMPNEIMTLCREPCYDHFMFQFANWLVYCNAMMNPILYCLLHERYRNAVVKLFRKMVNRCRDG